MCCAKALVIILSTTSRSFTVRPRPEIPKHRSSLPPNPEGIKTDYLWRKYLTREGLTDIIENYAQVVEEKDERTGRKKKTQIFPRYHQLDVVRRLLADARQPARGIAISSSTRRAAEKATPSPGSRTNSSD